MGGGNGQKSAAARAKNQKKKDAERKKNNSSSLQAQQNARDVFKCTRCMQTFGCTVKRPELEQHCANKHADHGFDQSFPNYEAKAAALKKPTNQPKPVEEKKTKKKKNGYAKRGG